MIKPTPASALARPLKADTPATPPPRPVYAAAPVERPVPAVAKGPQVRHRFNAKLPTSAITSERATRYGPNQQRAPTGLVYASLFEKQPAFTNLSQRLKTPAAIDFAALGNPQGAFFKKLTRFIEAKVKNLALAADLAQDALFLAMKNAHNFRGDSSADTWITGIANNLVKNHFHKNSGHRVDSLDDEEKTIREESYMSVFDLTGKNLPIEDKLIQKEQLTKALQRIEKLPPEMKEALLLRYQDELSYEEIAKIQNVPIGTVRSRLSRAKQAIQNPDDDFVESNKTSQ